MIEMCCKLYKYILCGYAFKEFCTFIYFHFHYGNVNPFSPGLNDLEAFCLFEIIQYQVIRPDHVNRYAPIERGRTYGFRFKHMF